MSMAQMIREPERKQGVAEFEDWLLGVIQKSPSARTLSKEEILDIATGRFGMTRYTATLTRSRVIAMLKDREASKVWSSSGRCGH